MKIVVCGAAGRTGRELVRVALERGHEVTALVHDAQGDLAPADGLHIVYGDVLVRETLAPAMAGADAVLWAVGPGSARRPVCRGRGSPTSRRRCATPACGAWSPSPPPAWAT